MAVSKFSTNSLKTPLKYSSLLAGNTAYDPYTTTLAYDSIASVSPSGTDTITFSSIPGTYSSLKLIYTSQSTYTAYNTNVRMRFNGDTADNYGDRGIFTDGNTPYYLYSNGPRGWMDLNYGIQTGTYMASGWGVGEVDIPNYAATDVYKNAQGLAGVNALSYPAGYFSNASGYWKSTAAITSITLYSSAGNYVAGSRFSLFGVK